MFPTGIPKDAMSNSGRVNESLAGVNLDQRFFAKGRLESTVENEPNANDRVNVEWGDCRGAVFD